MISLCRDKAGLSGMKAWEECQTEVVSVRVATLKRELDIVRIEGTKKIFERSRVSTFSNSADMASSPELKGSPVLGTIGGR